MITLQLCQHSLDLFSSVRMILIWPSAHCWPHSDDYILADSGFFKNFLYQGGVKFAVVLVVKDLKFKRSIFQTFWKPDFGARFLFIELDTFLCFFNLPKIQRGDPYKMWNINVVQPCWNFAQLSKIKNKQVAKIWGI